MQIGHDFDTPYDEDKRAEAVMECSCSACFGRSGRGTVHENGVMIMRSRLLLTMREKTLLTTTILRMMREDDADDGKGSTTSRAVAAAAESRDTVVNRVKAAAASAWNMSIEKLRNCTVHRERTEYACCMDAGGDSWAEVIRTGPGGEGTISNM